MDAGFEGGDEPGLTWRSVAKRPAPGAGGWGGGWRRRELEGWCVYEWATVENRERESS